MYDTFARRILQPANTTMRRATSAITENWLAPGSVRITNLSLLLIASIISIASFFTTFWGLQSYIDFTFVAFLFSFGIQALILIASVQIKQSFDESNYLSFLMYSIIAATFILISSFFSYSALYSGINKINDRLTFLLNQYQNVAIETTQAKLFEEVEQVRHFYYTSISTDLDLLSLRNSVISAAERYSAERAEASKADFAAREERRLASARTRADKVSIISQNIAQSTASLRSANVDISHYQDTLDNLKNQLQEMNARQSEMEQERNFLQKRLDIEINQGTPVIDKETGEVTGHSEPGNGPRAIALQEEIQRQEGILALQVEKIAVLVQEITKIEEKILTLNLQKANTEAELRVLKDERKILELDQETEIATATDKADQAGVDGLLAIFTNLFNAEPSLWDEAFRRCEEFKAEYEKNSVLRCELLVDKDLRETLNKWNRVERAMTEVCKLDNAEETVSMVRVRALFDCVEQLPSEGVSKQEYLNDLQKIGVNYDQAAHPFIHSLVGLRHGDEVGYLAAFVALVFDVAVLACGLLIRQYPSMLTLNSAAQMRQMGDKPHEDVLLFGFDGTSNESASAHIAERIRTLQQHAKYDQLAALNRFPWVYDRKTVDDIELEKELALWVPMELAAEIPEQETASGEAVIGLRASLVMWMATRLAAIQENAWVHQADKREPEP